MEWFARKGLLRRERIELAIQAGSELWGVRVPPLRFAWVGMTKAVDNQWFASGRKRDCAGQALRQQKAHTERLKRQSSVCLRGLPC